MPPKPEWIPTPAEIAAECLKIRAEAFEAMRDDKPPDMKSRSIDKRVVRNLIDRRKRRPE